MPTLEHNALVEMFRDNPDLAPHLVATLFHRDVPPHASVAVVESSLDQLIPVEFRADLVLELRNTGGAAVLAIVLEVQRDEDPDKKYSWPVYVTVVRARKRCATVVLVGQGAVKPLVLGPAVVPEITTSAAAETEMELAVLSAVVHGNGPNGLVVVQAVLGALGRLDQEHAAVYFQIIWNTLREPMRRALEALVMERQTEGKATYPPFIQRIFDQGEVQGKLEGKLDALLTVLQARGIAVPAEARERILAEKDAERLDHWLRRAATAPSLADVLDVPS